MNLNMELLGFKDEIITKIEKIGSQIVFYLELQKKMQICPSCSNTTTKVHDYRIQKIKHLPIEDNKKKNLRPRCSCLSELLAPCKHKVLKRNAFGFRRLDHFRAKILLNRKYQAIGVHLG